jgi:hypothetical protein
MIKVPCHSYCADCFTRLVATCLQHEQQWPPKCCLNKIPEYTIHAHTTANLRARYAARAEEWKIPISDRIYCSQASCSLFVRPSDVDKATNTARCSRRHLTCTICRAEAHSDRQECPRDRDLEQTNALAADEGWRRCHSCHAFVEHRDACRHITCRCGAQFCYVCGAVWETCGCTYAQLNSIKSRASRRRHERLMREQDEALQLRRDLEAIAEMEREERRKEELLARERARLERERRQRELEEKVKVESLRREKVKMRFEKMRLVLVTLGEMQEVLTMTTTESAAQELEKEKEGTVARMSKTHEGLRAKIEAEAAVKIEGERRAKYEEYAARVEHEKELEDGYRNTLEQQFAGRPDADEQINTAMDAYRATNDGHYAVWEKDRKEGIEKIEYEATEEKGIQLERLAIERRKKDEEFVAREEELEKVGRAGKKWLVAVFTERARLLGEKENDEIENGGEDFSKFLTEEEKKGLLEGDGGHEMAESSATGAARSN